MPLNDGSLVGVAADLLGCMGCDDGYVAQGAELDRDVLDKGVGNCRLPCQGRRTGGSSTSRGTDVAVMICGMPASCCSAMRLRAIATALAACGRRCG